jgi:NAD(P) transhydrogenase subunit alpha
MQILILFIVLIVATLLGYKLLRAVPPALHTPLMSGMNALSGVTLLAALAVAGLASGERYLGAAAIILATVNVVGGFLITHRMLKMFRKNHGDKQQ